MSRGLRILALVTDAFGGYGGIAQYNRDLFCALSGSAAVERVVILPRLAEGASGDLPDKIVQRAPMLRPWRYALKALVTVLRQGPFDVVFCGHIYHVPLAEMLRRLFGLRVWVQTHGVDAWDRPSRLVGRSFDRATLVTTVSRYTRRRMLEWSRISADQIRVLPNTVRPLFTPGPRDEAMVTKFGLEGSKIILTVSRLSRADTYKGHDRVIAVLPQVRKVHPSAVYVVVGDGDARADLEAQVAREDLAGAVRFLGRLSDDDVLALYRAADVFIMPSTKEGFGIVFVEAAATGLAVIAGNCDGSVDALADGALGLLVDPRSNQEIGTALVAALGASHKQNPGAAARFSFDRFVTHVDALVRTLAA